MSGAMIWLHEDAMRADHPVFAAAANDAPQAVFIWDADYFKAQGYSRKRLTFIYESLMELPITLYQGDTETVLRELLSDQRLLVPETANPHFREIVQNLRGDFQVAYVMDTPFIDVPANIDLKRFFRFWNKARRSALTPSAARLFGINDAAE